MMLLIISIFSHLIFSNAIVIKTPLIWKRSYMLQLLSINQWTDQQSHTLHHTFQRPHLLAVVSQHVSDYSDVEYFANITIGTPEQQFLVSLDTAFANLIVCGVSCTNCGNKQRFNNSTSSTFIKDGQKWSFSHGWDNARGFQGIDTVRLGGKGESQLAIPKTTIDIAEYIPKSMLNYRNDGVLGLAFTSQSINHVVPPLINAVNQGLLDQPLFTVYLMRRGLADNAYGGQFTYGDIDTENCGSVIAYQPLSSATYFQFTVQGFALGSYSIRRQYQAITATATAFIGGPVPIINGLAQAAGAKYHDDSKLYWINCDQRPSNLDITIGANTYCVEADNLIIRVNSTSNQCLFAMFGFDAGGFGATWMLGDSFLRQYCTIHDIGKQRIGFAKTNPKR